MCVFAELELENTSRDDQHDEWVSSNGKVEYISEMPMVRLKNILNSLNNKQSLSRVLLEKKKRIMYEIDRRSIKGYEEDNEEF